MIKPRSKRITFIKLVRIMAQLRHPRTGCPWDNQQSHRTLIKYLREETAELIRAVYRKDYNNLKEELGDLLLQVLFHAQLAREKKQFDIYDVIDTLGKKLIRRHPHVFAGKKVRSLTDLIRTWNEIKVQEKKLT